MSFIRLLFSAGIGWFLAGPIGSIIGVVIAQWINREELAYLKDEERRSGQQSGSRRQSYASGAQERDGFLVSLLVLLAAVMKADGRVVKSELDFVKVHLRKVLRNDEEVQRALLLLREVLKKDIPLADVCHQIRINLNYYEKVQLLHLLRGLSVSDGALVSSEISLLHNISKMLGISEADYASVMNMYKVDREAAYKVLEVEPSATDEDLKKAYRKMAVRFHPDKVAHLGKEVEDSAKEKFQKVNEAYEKIKKERGMV
ncbi:MAG TPA: molecular chaperone DjlA [Marinilabiliaceae bacterium]|nr:molecular chaperone DjlA [Marinilabiliaceae bacterium]